MIKEGILFLLLATSFSIKSFASSVSISAVVNGTPITSYEVDERTKLAKSLLSLNKVKMKPEKVRKQVLTELIDDRLKIAEAKKYGVNVSREELDEARKKMEIYLKIPNGYDALIKQLDIESKIVDEKVEADVIWMKFVYTVLRSYIKVSDAEVNLLVDNMMAEEHFRYDLVPLITTMDKYNGLRDKLSSIKSCDKFIAFAKQNGESGSGYKLSLEDNTMEKNLHNLIVHSPIKKSLSPIQINGKDTVFFICGKERYLPIISDAKKEELKMSIYQGKLDAFANKYFDKLKKTSVIEINE